MSTVSTVATLRPQNRTLAPMIEIETKDATDKLRELHQSLTGKQFNTAVARALTHTANRMNTASSREVRKVYNIKAANLGRFTKVVPASPNMKKGNTLTAFVKADKGTLGMGNFKPKEIRVEKSRSLVWKSNLKSKKTSFSKGKKEYGKAVQVEIVKGNKQVLKQTWLKTFGSGRTAIFARGKYVTGGFEWGANREQFRSLKTKSPFFAILNKDVSKNLMRVGAEGYEKRVIHELTKGLRHTK